MFNYVTQDIYHSVSTDECLISAKYGVVVLYNSIINCNHDQKIKDLRNSFKHNYLLYIVDQINNGNYDEVSDLDKTQLYDIINKYTTYLRKTDQLGDNFYTHIINNYDESYYNIFDFLNVSKQFVLKYFDIYYKHIFKSIKTNNCSHMFMKLFSSNMYQYDKIDIQPLNSMLTKQDRQKIGAFCKTNSSKFVYASIVGVYIAYLRVLIAKYHAIPRWHIPKESFNTPSQLSDFDNIMIDILHDDITQRIKRDISYYKIDIPSYNIIIKYIAETKDTPVCNILKQIFASYLTDYDDIVDDLHDLFS